MGKPLISSRFEVPILRLRFLGPDNTLHQATWHSTWTPQSTESKALLRLNLIQALSMRGRLTDVRLMGMSFLGSSVTELG